MTATWAGTTTWVSAPVITTWTSARVRSTCSTSRRRTTTTRCPSPTGPSPRTSPPRRSPRTPPRTGATTTLPTTWTTDQGAALPVGATITGVVVVVVVVEVSVVVVVVSVVVVRVFLCVGGAWTVVVDSTAVRVIGTQFPVSNPPAASGTRWWLASAMRAQTLGASPIA